MINAIVLTFSSLVFGVNATDSIRTEVINGKTYIIHQAEAKETLFSISRKYGVALIAVVESNPDASSGLDVGQLIKVPYSPNNRSKTSEGTIHRVGQKETLYSISKQYGVTVDDIKSWNNLTDSGLKLGQELLIKPKTTETRDNVLDNKANTHTVVAGETMYAISRKYSITIPQIREWNKLESNDLKPGQIIFISGGEISNKTKDVPVLVEEESKRRRRDDKSSNTPIPVIDPVIGSDEVHETGIATLLEGTDGNRKYLAHHRTVKPGTIIRVKNNATRKEVFVRVIGTLPATEASDVVLRVSKSAFDKLGGEGNFQVEISYFK
jgi:LysM repeat protein